MHCHPVGKPRTGSGTHHCCPGAPGFVRCLAWTSCTLVSMPAEFRSNLQSGASVRWACQPSRALARHRPTRHGSSARQVASPSSRLPWASTPAYNQGTAANASAKLLRTLELYQSILQVPALPMMPLSPGGRPPGFVWHAPFVEPQICDLMLSCSRSSLPIRKRSFAVGGGASMLWDAQQAGSPPCIIWSCTPVRKQPSTPTTLPRTAARATRRLAAEGQNPCSPTPGAASRRNLKCVASRSVQSEVPPAAECRAADPKRDQGRSGRSHPAP